MGWSRKNVEDDVFCSNKLHIFWICQEALTLIIFESIFSLAIENKGKTVTDKSKLANLFNSHYINIEEKMSGCLPEIEGSPENKTNDKATVRTIIRKY